MQPACEKGKAALGLPEMNQVSDLSSPETRIPTDRRIAPKRHFEDDGHRVAKPVLTMLETAITMRLTLIHIVLASSSKRESMLALPW